MNTNDHQTHHLEIKEEENLETYLTLDGSLDYYSSSKSRKYRAYKYRLSVKGNKKTEY